MRLDLGLNDSGTTMTNEATRPRVLSGITPSGPLTLGNHLGALRRFVAGQDTSTGFFFVADLHAMTTGSTVRTTTTASPLRSMLPTTCGHEAERCARMRHRSMPRRRFGSASPMNSWPRSTRGKNGCLPDRWSTRQLPTNASATSSPEFIFP